MARTLLLQGTKKKSAKRISDICHTCDALAGNMANFCVNRRLQRQQQQQQLQLTTPCCNRADQNIPTTSPLPLPLCPSPLPLSLPHFLFPIPIVIWGNSSSVEFVILFSSVHLPGQALGGSGRRGVRVCRRRHVGVVGHIV